jgi:hypothetical protein
LWLEWSSAEIDYSVWSAIQMIQCQHALSMATTCDSCPSKNVRRLLGQLHAPRPTMRCSLSVLGSIVTAMHPGSYEANQLQSAWRPRLSIALEGRRELSLSFGKRRQLASHCILDTRYSRRSRALLCVEGSCRLTHCPGIRGEERRARLTTVWRSLSHRFPRKEGN